MEIKLEKHFIDHFRVDEELNKLIVEESDSRQKVENKEHEMKSSRKEGNESDLQSEIDADGDIHGGGIGTISFVSCGNKEAKEAAEQQVTSTHPAKEEGEKDILIAIVFNLC